MGDVQEYGDVVQEIRGALNPGKLKLSTSNILFKNVKTGKLDQFQGGDVTKAQWLKRAKGYCLKFILNNDTIHRYDGFKDAEFEKLAKFISNHYAVSLEKVDMSLKGWNWGTAEFEANALNFKVESNLAFEIPLTNVMNATAAKNEVTVEFHPNDDAPVSLIEVRFHIPPNPPEIETDAVEEFHKSVMANADIIQISGESICTLAEVQCLTPRGRYDLKLYPTFLQLHGKTFDYKIPYQTILRLFLLPHKDGRQMYFVVSLDPPIKQGQTRYHFLILLFQKEDEMSLELTLEEEEIKTKYEDKLQKEMAGLEYEVVSKVFKAITGRKITVPGNFTSHHGAQAVTCSYKASTGLLYPLERGFVFVHKPPLHIRFDEVAHVNFARSSGSNRSFDFEVDTKVGATFTFVGVEKDEYGKLYEFVKSKNLRVKNLGEKGGKSVYNEMSDSDAEGGAHDAYLERMKAEGKDRDDSDDDSSDSDFNPGDSGSDVLEEYDSNPPTTSGSDSSDYSGNNSDQYHQLTADEIRAKAEKRKEKEAKRREKAEARRLEKEKQAKERKPRAPRESGGSRKRKGKKDPNAPKRPQSAYFIWLNEHREQIKTDNPGITITEISKKAGQMWGEVSDKTEWEEKAKKAKADYMEAMEEYKKNKADSESESDDGKSKAKKAAKSPKKKAESTAGGGGGGSFKSKEYIESSGISDLSSDSDDEKDESKEEEKKSSPKASDAESAKGSGDEKENSGSEKEASDKEASDKEASEKEASEKEASGSEQESGSD